MKETKQLFLLMDSSGCLSPTRNPESKKFINFCIGILLPQFSPFLSVALKVGKTFHAKFFWGENLCKILYLICDKYFL